MALKNNDYFFLNSTITQFKSSLFNLVSEWGADHSTTFLLTYNGIKEATGRERLTPIAIQDYVSYLVSHGFIAEAGPHGITAEGNVRSLILTPNESISVSNALEIFRSRAHLHGDVDNY
ncbi:hypothetical protein [Serratia fonticola]|uniref:hypothetical protein n=1 Tax=Serratia fonticola TaxID=47917 RepID=UPI001378560A|nr:hypothetical protein [Serratia fonticola]NCG53707.1 hypothetical protein [Serratia fonticola]